MQFHTQSTLKQHDHIIHRSENLQPKTHSHHQLESIRQCVNNDYSRCLPKYPSLRVTVISSWKLFSPGPLFQELAADSLPSLGLMPQVVRTRIAVSADSTTVRCVNTVLFPIETVLFTISNSRQIEDYKQSSLLTTYSLCKKPLPYRLVKCHAGRNEHFEIDFQ